MIIPNAKYVSAVVYMSGRPIVDFAIAKYYIMIHGGSAFDYA